MEDLETNEISCIRLELTQAKRIILIGNLYRHPDSLIGYNKRFEDFVDKVSNKGKEIILKGDFNENVCNDHCVTNWLHFMLFGGLSQLICHPTEVTSNSRTSIDHIYTNRDENISSASVSKLTIKDHYTIFVNCRLNSS